MQQVEGCAVVVGVGPSQGLGAALCRRFAAAGLQVFAAGRTAANLETVCGEIAEKGGRATPVITDTRDPAAVDALFDTATATGEPLKIAVFNAGNNSRRRLLETDPDFFEAVWRTGCFGGLLVAQAAARKMLPNGAGTLLFTGATASLRGKPPFMCFAAAKAGLRSLAQSVAKELGPQGIHVGHIIVDGGIFGEKIMTNVPEMVERKGEDGLLNPDAIAESYWQMHLQDRTAWTFELDVRPYKESF